MSELDGTISNIDHEDLLNTILVKSIQADLHRLNRNHFKGNQRMNIIINTLFVEIHMAKSQLNGLTRT